MNMRDRVHALTSAVRELLQVVRRELMPVPERRVEHQRLPLRGMKPHVLVVLDQQSLPLSQQRAHGLLQWISVPRSKEHFAAEYSQNIFISLWTHMHYYIHRLVKRG